jgi:AcrR family transcriptional regulator
MSARNIILETAFALFVGHGYTAVSVNDICRVAGVTKGGFYHHWNSKEELFTEILIEGYLPEMEKLMGSIKISRDPDDRLLSFFTVWGQAFRDTGNHPEIPNKEFGLWYLFLEGLNHNPPFREGIKAFYGRLLILSAEIIRNGQISGRFRSDMKAEEIARALVAQLEGTAILLMTGNGGDPEALYSAMGRQFVALISIITD